MFVNKTGSNGCGQKPDSNDCGQNNRPKWLLTKQQTQMAVSKTTGSNGREQNNRLKWS